MSIFASSNQNRTHNEDKRTYQKIKSRWMLVCQARQEPRLVVEPNHAKDVPSAAPCHPRHQTEPTEKHLRTIGGQILTPFKDNGGKTMEKVTVIIEMNDDGSYTAVPQHNYKIGFFGEGNTVDEAIIDLNNSLAEAKEELPELPEMEWDLKFDTASFLQFYGDRLSLAGLQAITGINRKQLSHYVTGHSRPSAATVQKIQAGITNFSQQLGRVCLI